jgi:hypothetical protein
LRVSLSLLSDQERRETVAVPASLCDRSLGVVRVTLTEIPRADSDRLASTVTDLAERLAQARRDGQSREATAPLREALRTAEDAVLRATVVGHDPSDFSAAVPPGVPLEVLRDRLPEYSDDDLLAAQASGVLCRGFSPGVWRDSAGQERRGASPEMCRFYRAARPRDEFAAVLLAVCLRWHRGEDCDAETLWHLAGTPALVQVAAPPPAAEASPARPS